ncbi:MAG TPA: CBS domain-containing protein [Marmoricola sp.]|nr:CBS domain-containing protein [Marmoricola sp.]
MRAVDLMEDYPSLDMTASALDAARALAAEHRPALVVLDHGRPFTVLPASQVIALLVPPWLQEDPSLVHVFDEKGADEAAKRLRGKAVRDVLPVEKDRRELPVVPPTATLIECAALMARLRTPLVVVADRDGAMQGAVTAATLLETLLAAGS